MLQDTFVALDIETTGLDPKRDRIIEIGAAWIEKGEVIKTFESFVNPRRHITDFVTELTGIQNEMLENAPDMEEVMEAFLAFCGEQIILGHHVIFDYSFLKRNALKIGHEFERSGIDTLRIAREYLPNLEKRSLEALCMYYQIKNPAAHRALFDALAAAELYQKLADEFYQIDAKGVFEPQPLLYKVKKESPITLSQLKYLKELIAYHKLNIEMELEYLSKSEASRMIDQILSTYGRIH